MTHKSRDNLSTALKRLLKPLVPPALIEARLRRVRRAIELKFSGQSPREVFAEVYESGLWGDGGTDGYYSGTGSHHSDLTDGYLRAVRDFLGEFAAPPNVVDLGCGDFNIGRQLRPLCDRYTACDVVPALVERNRSIYADLDVDFRCLDIASDELPEGDVVLVRQVLQHLSNTHIARVVPKLSQYTYLILSEHLPAASAFVPNRAKLAGPHIRLGLEGGDSGIVLTAPPFNLRCADEKILCEAKEYRGRIVTTVYRLR